jgi:hypothetical protein
MTRELLTARIQHQIRDRRLRFRVDPNLCSVQRLKSLGLGILREFDGDVLAKSTSQRTGVMTFVGKDMTVVVKPLTGNVVVECQACSDFDRRLATVLRRHGFNLLALDDGAASVSSELRPFIETAGSLAVTACVELLLPCKVRTTISALQFITSILNVFASGFSVSSLTKAGVNYAASRALQRSCA